MRTFALKTQYTVLVAFLCVFALGAGVTQALRGRAQWELLSSLRRDVAIAVKLPRLKGELRRLDLAVSQYLQTGRGRWLDEHGRALEELRRVQDDLARLFPDGRERGLLEELDRQLAERFELERGLIRRREAGRLAPEEAARLLATRRSYEDVLETVLLMHDVSLRELPRQIAAAEREARRALWLSLLGGAAVSALLAFALSRYIIEPVSALSAYAASWTPGKPWACPSPAVSPEIDRLYERVGQLVEGLNREYRNQRELNELKSRFVSLVSHELNNALSVIHAASFNLEETDREADEKRRKMYRVVQRQVRRLSTTVGNLLNAARLESGKLALRRKKMEMSLVLKSSLELLEPLHEEKGLKVSLSVPSEPAPVYADPDALTLVATNLLSNAIKYTPAGGSVSAGVRHEGPDRAFVRVYVQDTGIGIPEGERDRIFSGYYRSEAAQRVEKGFGIGLSLAKSIIEAHGGRIEVESAPGRGSTFSFLLPLWRPRTGREEGAETRAVLA